MFSELERRGVSIGLLITALRVAVLLNRETDPLFVADFPLGSLESRAAVRSLLIRTNQTGTSQGDVYPPGWSAKTAAQKTAVESSADILFFGGAAGSLKTETMLDYAGF